MISKHQIHQYIKRLYSQEPDDDTLEYELEQFTSMRSDLVYALVELFDTTDIRFKQFIVRAIDLVENTHSFPILTEIMYKSDKSDEIKVYAAIIMGYLGGFVDHSVLKNALTTPDDLDKIITQNLLRDLESPFFFQDFLKLFPELPFEQKLAILASLESRKGDARLAEIAGALLNYCDSNELLDGLVRVLQCSQSTNAYPFLKQIIQKSTSREVQALARKAIFALGELDKKGELLRLEPQNVFHEAYVSSHDGSGNQICVFATKSKNRHIKLFSFIVCDSDGISEAFGNEFSRHEYADYINEIKHNDAFLFVKVSPEHIINKTKQVEAQEQAINTQLPHEYTAWRDIFNCQYDTGYWDKKNVEYNKLIEDTKSELDKLIPRSIELFEDKAIYTSWILNHIQLQDDLDRLEPLYDSFGAGSKKLYEEMEKACTNSFSRIFDKRFIELLRVRLLEFSYLSFLKNRIFQAQLAFATAHSFQIGNIAENLFLNFMLRYSFTYYIEEDDDLEYEDDQLDIFDDELDLDFEEEREEERLLRALNRSRNAASGVTEPESEPDTIHRPALLPENSDLSSFEKLDFLRKTLPEMSFSKSFPPHFKSLPAEQQVRLLNLWEFKYDEFIFHMVGDIFWEDLRNELVLTIDSKILEGFTAEVETEFLGRMPERGYNWEHLRLARRLWKEFVFVSGNQLKPKKRHEAWAAAIEYLTGAVCFDRDPQAIVAADYNVSTATLAARYKKIIETLNITVYRSDVDKQFHQLSDFINLLSKINKEDV
ncbi:hypothetical protein JXJ21_26320 [candidate division KSB1 bacterium]|nr:hypothetical protein [candidate division KSB1 bacterium]